MSLFYYEVKQAWQSLQKKKGYSRSIILTIGITLGALLCILTLNYLLLIKPLTYPEQDKLFLANHVLFDQAGHLQTRDNSTGSIIELYQDNSVFSDSAILNYSWSLIETHPSQPLVNTIETVPEYFKLFSVPIIKGRGFEQTEAINERHPVAVISFKAWLKYFNKATDILDKKIELAGMSYRIIGVIGSQFVEPQIYQVGRETDVWLPWDVQDNLKFLYDQWNTYDTGVFIGKLKDGVSMNQGEQKLTSILDELWQEEVLSSKNLIQVEKKDWSSQVELTPVINAILGDTRSLALLMLAAVIGLVLITSTNVINLLMARTVETQKKLAIHATLGAKKNHLYQLFFAEISILMFGAILLALILANVGFEIMRNYFSTVLPRVSELGIDLFTVVSGIIIMLSLSMILAKAGTQVIDYRSLNSVLVGGGKGTGFQVSKKIRSRLIILQVAIASFLLFFSINLGIRASEPIFQSKGFSVEDLYELYLPPSKLPFPDAKKRNAFVVDIKRIFSQDPAVEIISHSSHIYNAARKQHFIVLGKGKDHEQTISALEDRVDQQYFSMIGQTILQGDNFSLTDIDNVYRERAGEVEENENKVAIVNQAFAKKIQLNGQVIGQLIRIGPYSPFKIIGIVKDAIRAPLTIGEPRVYTPSTESGFAFIIKFRPGMSLSREKIVALVKQAGSKNPPYGYGAVSETHQLRLFAKIATSIATATLSMIVMFLVMIGLYGIVNYGTQMRRFELGARLAIGAKRKDLIKLILTDNLNSIFLGLSISVFIILTTMITLPEVVTNFSVLQLILIFSVTVLLISLVSLVACYLPLRQYINRAAIYSLRGSE